MVLQIMINVPMNYQNSKIFTCCVHSSSIQISSVMNYEVGRPLHAVSCIKNDTKFSL
jgi:hypothetical protein